MTSKIIDEGLYLEPHGEHLWRVHTAFSIGTFMGNVTVSKGFITDLASTPRIIWGLIPPFGRYTLAAVVHDFLYAGHKFNRKNSDIIFFNLMIRDEVPRLKARIMYLAVRIFGKQRY